MFQLNQRRAQLFDAQRDRSSWTQVQSVSANNQCPLWIKSRHLHCKSPCLLYPQKRTLSAPNGGGRISASGRKAAGTVQSALPVASFLSPKQLSRSDYRQASRRDDIALLRLGRRRSRAPSTSRWRWRPRVRRRSLHAAAASLPRIGLTFLLSTMARSVLISCSSAEIFCTSLPLSSPAISMAHSSICATSSCVTKSGIVSICGAAGSGSYVL